MIKCEIINNWLLCFIINYKKKTHHKWFRRSFVCSFDVYSDLEYAWSQCCKNSFTPFILIICCMTKSPYLTVLSLLSCRSVQVFFILYLCFLSLLYFMLQNPFSFYPNFYICFGFTLCITPFLSLSLSLFSLGTKDCLPAMTHIGLLCREAFEQTYSCL